MGNKTPCVVMIGLLLVSGCSIAFAAPAETKEVESPKLLIQSVLSGADKVEGVVSKGGFFDAFSKTTSSGAPVHLTVSSVKRFKQQGCARVRVEMRQEDVPTKDGKKVPFAMRNEWNVCRNGTPPMESVDLAEIARLQQREK